MEKVTKKELQQEINILKCKNITNRNLIFRIKRALASINIEIMDDEFDAEPEPKLKVLDQSVFDGLDAKWQFAAVNSDGVVVLYIGKPSTKWHEERGIWCFHGFNGDTNMLRGGYCTINWQNSLIERKELTGSDLCRAMLKRGDKTVLCAVSDDGDFEADAYDAICRVDEDGLFESHCTFWWYVQPINNQGEPLTQSEVGL